MPTCNPSILEVVAGGSKFIIILGYIVSLRPIWVMLDSVLKPKLINQMAHKSK